MSERTKLLSANAKEDERRQRAMSQAERAEGGRERLAQSARAASASADAGEEILRELHDQRDKILSARASAGHMERDMDRSERKMYQLGCEKCMQRWAFCALVTLVLGGLSFFLWWRLSHREREEVTAKTEEAILGREFMRFARGGGEEYAGLATPFRGAARRLLGR